MPTDADVALVAAEAGAAVVRRDYGTEHERLVKSATDFATRTDLDAEAAILDVLSALRPDDACTGEESGDQGPSGSPRRWFVDPLCGTLNFAATTPPFVVNVALRVDGVGRAAAAVDPIAGEAFWSDGSGAFVRGDATDRPLVPSPATGIVEINCDGPVDRPFVGGQLVQDARFRSLYAPRVVSSSIGVPWVAAGRRAAYVSDGACHESVHFAAGITIARAAGCVVTDLVGGPLESGRGLLVSSDAPTHAAMLALVEPHLADRRS